MEIIRIFVNKDTDKFFVSMSEYETTLIYYKIEFYLKSIPEIEIYTARVCI